MYRSFNFFIGLVLVSLYSGCVLVRNSGHLSNEKVFAFLKAENQDCEQFTCIKEVSPILQSQLKKQGKQLIQIYLVRHAKVNIKKKVLYSAKETQQYMDDYNRLPIQDFDPALVHVELNPGHVIYCSNLPRSKETASKIFGEPFPIVPNPVFREFEIKAVGAQSLVKLPLPFWQFISRTSWFMGFNHRGIESYKEARQRALQGANSLITIAKKEETSVLIGHGMLHRYIARELLRQGWIRISSKGHINLGATLMVKIEDLP